MPNFNWYKRGFTSCILHSWLLNDWQSTTGYNVTLSNNRELFSAGWNKTKWIEWLILNRLIDTTVFEPTTLCFWLIHMNIGLCFTYLWSLNPLSPRNELPWLLNWIFMNLRTSSINHKIDQKFWHLNLNWRTTNSRQVPFLTSALR